MTGCEFISTIHLTHEEWYSILSIVVVLFAIRMCR